MYTTCDSDSYFLRATKQHVHAFEMYSKVGASRTTIIKAKRTQSKVTESKLFLQENINFFLENPTYFVRKC
jgi:hypothetical protein